MATQKPPPKKADATLFGVPAAELAILRDIAQKIESFPEIHQPSKQDWLRHAMSSITLLESIGFRRQQVLDALESTGISDYSVLLQELLVLTPLADLPKVFALQADAESGEAKAVLVHSSTDQCVKTQQSDHQAAIDNLIERPDAGKASEAPPKQQKKPTKDKAVALKAQKNWILASLEEDHESESDGSASRASDIEDWELWGKPEEIAAKAAERGRKKQLDSLSREDLALTLVTELDKAMADAARAKKAGDKEKQQAAGVSIRQIKSEMAEYKLSVDEVDTVRQSAAQQSGTGEQHLEEVQDAEEGSKQPLPTTPPSTEELGVQTVQDQKRDSDDDDNGPLGSLFDMERAVDELERTARKGPRVGPPQRLLSKLKKTHVIALPPSNKRQSSKKNGPASTQTPKQALATFYHARSLPAPRYEKLPAGGGRSQEGGARYSVSGHEPVSSKRGSRKTLLRTVTLPLQEDGWDSIEEAQNAVATRALHLLTPEEEGTWQHIPKQYQEMWFDWVDEEERNRSEPSVQTDENELDDALLAVYERVSQGLTKQSGSEGNMNEMRDVDRAVMPRNPLTNKKQREREVSASLLRQRSAWLQTEQGESWTQERSRLPIAQIKDHILAASLANDVVIVAAETGSGKTTQVPQYILDEAILNARGSQASIICTQPRRVAAISVADRVAEERGESGPGNRDELVGYQVRFDAACTPSTRLCFVTTGILLRRLEGDPDLAGISHVIVDEVHERTVEGDFLLTLLRELVNRRRSMRQYPPLKLVLMSATMDHEALSSYFGDAPVLRAGGRTFPVSKYYLEDAYEAIGYKLEPGSRCMLRDRSSNNGRGGSRKMVAVGKNRSRSWVDNDIHSRDDGAFFRPLNPNYDAALYENYSQQTRRNLASLDEQEIDYELIVRLVEHIDEVDRDRGAVLVFLPGMAEIRAVEGELLMTRRASNVRQDLSCEKKKSGGADVQPYGNQQRPNDTAALVTSQGRKETFEKLAACARERGGHSPLWVVTLHGSTPSAAQRDAFRRAPLGCRKVVLATNIAETSVTIDDITHVIDSGRLNEQRYSAARRTPVLARAWVSAAAAAQRAGRAGRVQSGQAWALYTKRRAERLVAHQAPEIDRVPLAETVLRVHALGAGLAGPFLERAPHPPPAAHVREAVSVLQGLGALDALEALTPLGRQLAVLPLDAPLGKLLVLGVLWGCASPAASIAACLSYEQPWSGRPNSRSGLPSALTELPLSARGQMGDLLLAAAGIKAWIVERGRHRAMASKRAAELGMDADTLRTIADIRTQAAHSLATLGWLPRKDPVSAMDDHTASWNRHATKPSAIAALLAAAFSQNLLIAVPPALSDGPAGRISWREGNKEIFIHPRSLLASVTSMSGLSYPFVSYFEKMQTSRVFALDCTPSSTLATLLFGSDLKAYPEIGVAELEGNNIRIKVPAPTLAMLQRLRTAYGSLVSQVPARQSKTLTSEEHALVDCLVGLLDAEDAARHHQLTVA